MQRFGRVRPREVQYVLEKLSEWGWLDFAYFYCDAIFAKNPEKLRSKFQFVFLF